MPAVYKPRPHLQCFCYNSPRCLRRHTGVSNTGLHPGVPKVGDLQIQPWCVWPLPVGTEHTLGLSEPPFLLLGKTADAHWPRQLVCGSGGTPREHPRASPWGTEDRCWLLCLQRLRGHMGGFEPCSVLPPGVAWATTKDPH